MTCTDPLHRELKARAARAGMSLSDSLLQIVRRAAETLDAPLLTRDRTLAAVPGCDARVEVV